MTKKCSASHCITASSRSSKISCAKCRKPFHLKCVGLSASQHKALRDFPGAEWFCPACRNSPFDLEQSSINPALNLILARLTSILRLVGAQIDVTRTLCRALNDSNRRSSSCMPDPRPSQPAPVNEARNFEDALNNIQFEFSNVFGSFIADAANISDAKRDRTSSLSSSNVISSRSGKKMRVDVSVDTSDMPNFTVSSISGDASVSIPVSNGTISIVDTNATPSLTASTGTTAADHLSDHSAAPANTATSTVTITTTSGASSISNIAATSTSTANSSTNATTTSSTPVNSSPATTITATATTTSSKATIAPSPSIASSPAITTAITTTAITTKSTATVTSPTIANAISTSSTVSKSSLPPYRAVQTCTKDCSTQTKLSSPKPQRLAQSLPQQPANATAVFASLNHATTTTTSTTIATTHAIQPPAPPLARIIVPSSISQPIMPPVGMPIVHVPSSGENTNTSNGSSQGSSINTRPSLAVAPTTPSSMALNSSRNWFYLTKFQPHETEANIISYIAHHAHCEPSLVTCHRLIRSGDERPRSFLSFKLNVPSNIEQILLSDGFWPNGVSMTPFLDRRSNSHKPTGARKQTRANRPTPVVQNQSTPSSRPQQAPRLQPERPTTTPAPRQEDQRVQPPRPITAPQQPISCPPKPPLPKIRATLV